MAGITEVPNTGTRHNIFPKYHVEFGPWNQGLILSKKPTLISPAALQECVNYSVLDDGTLKLRPPVTSDGPLITLGTSYFDYRIYTRALGSLITPNTRVRLPVVALAGPTALLGGVSGNKVKFFYYQSGAWHKGFDDLVYISLPSGQSLIPLQTFGYNSKYWVVLNFSGVDVATSMTTALTGTPMGPAQLASYGGTDTTSIRKAVVFKDRILIMSRADLYWSDINPSGVATDWSGTAPHTAGNLGLIRELFNEQLNDMIVFNNSIYIASNSSISRFSWSSNPGVSGDGSFQNISNQIGGHKFEVYNGNLYLFNENGLYRLVNNYFVEVSEPVRKFIRTNNHLTSLQELVVNKFAGVDANGISNVPDFALNMHKLQNLLLLGPYNLNAARRNSETINELYTGNLYLVYNMDTNVWTKWQFSPNDTSGSPIAGPQGAIIELAAHNPATVDNYFWVGLHLDHGNKDESNTYYPQSVYRIDADALSGDIVDTDASMDIGNTFGGTRIDKWIGSIFETSEVDLGDGNSWKRIQTSTLDADPWDDPGNFSAGLPTMGYLLGDNPRVVSPTVQGITAALTTGRLTFAGGFRARRVGFFYDSITGIYAAEVGTKHIGLDRVVRVSTYITLSRKEPSGIAAL